MGKNNRLQKSLIDSRKWPTEETRMAVQSRSTMTTTARRHRTPWRYPEARGVHWVTCSHMGLALGYFVWVVMEGCSPRLENVGEQDYSYIMQLLFSTH